LALWRADRLGRGGRSVRFGRAAGGVAGVAGDLKQLGSAPQERDESASIAFGPRDVTARFEDRCFPRAFLPSALR
jgi:hypothetical protein